MKKAILVIGFVTMVLTFNGCNKPQEVNIMGIRPGIDDYEVVNNTLAKPMATVEEENLKQTIHPVAQNKAAFVTVNYNQDYQVKSVSYWSSNGLSESRNWEEAANFARFMLKLRAQNFRLEFCNCETTDNTASRTLTCTDDGNIYRFSYTYNLEYSESKIEKI
ncbi:MAG: hypothetical protein NTZ49_05695 [Candidatus Parcubacteria bacterium]|nr:hypothetical protein [Candidatus Parcubacteria bacterium]